MIKPCRDCPAVERTKAAMDAINLGCLPDCADMHKLNRVHGRVWACHERPEQPCAGFVLSAVEHGCTLNFSLPLATESNCPRIHED